MSKIITDAAVKAAAPQAIFNSAIDGDTPLQAAAREAGWALIKLVDSIDWTKREKVSGIITRLGIALSEPAAAREAELAQTRRKALEEAVAKAENFTGAEWIAHDMRIGIFPKQSKPGIPIAASIRTLIEEEEW